MTVDISQAVTAVFVSATVGAIITGLIQYGSYKQWKDEVAKEFEKINDKMSTAQQDISTLTTNYEAEKAKFNEYIKNASSLMIDLRETQEKILDKIGAINNEILAFYKRTK